jgi:exosortase/archaeosortase family protein
MVERRAADNTIALLLGVTAAAMLMLPFITTFDDFLTTLAMRTGLDHAIGWLVPGMARVVAGMARTAGINASASSGGIVLRGHLQPMLISWNCIGWQSLVLFGLSMVTGLRGPHPALTRIQVVLIGAAGTILLNLVRVFMVVWLAAGAGYVPAVLFHDYGGTLMVIAWLFAFWALAHRWILAPESDLYRGEPDVA